MITVKNRKLSFLLVLAVYAVAAAVGILTYRALAPWPLFASLLVADVAATVAVFLFSLLFGNASVYDPYWSVQPPVILLLLAFSFEKALAWVDVLLLAVIFLWALRLTANWAYTFGGLTHQDWRYTMLSEKTGALYPVVNFVGIHTVPTLVVYGCVLPAAYAILRGVSLNFGSIVFLCLSVGAAVMQGIADVQMHKFRKNRDGRFIRRGLWK
jgi:steroid 5-alpha reductase family enzyme